MASIASPAEVLKIIDYSLKGDFAKAKSLLLKTMLDNGLSGIDVIKQIQKQVWKSSASDNVKLEMIKACGEIEFRLVEGSDEFIQLEALLAWFSFLGE